MVLDRNWNREPNLRSLLHIEPTLPTTQLEFTSSGLSGNITGYREVSTTGATRTALNSTSLERKPASYEGSFVRGKSSYFPFRPGGLGDVVLDEDSDVAGEGNLDRATQGLEKAFEKGRGKFPSKLVPLPRSTRSHQRLSQVESARSRRALLEASTLVPKPILPKTAPSSRRKSKRSRSSPSIDPCLTCRVTVGSNLK